MKKQITDAYIARSITLLRAAEGEAIQSASMLGKVHDAVLADIEKVFKKPPTKTQVEKLKKSIGKKLESFYKDQWPKELIDAQKEVITKEIIWNNNLIESVRDKEKLVAPRYVSSAAVSQSKLARTLTKDLVKSASKRKYQGKTFEKHIAKAFPNESKRIGAALTNGFNEGKNVGQLTRDVKAIAKKSTLDVKTISRSFFMHNATEAKEKVYQLNPDVVESIIWVSTLDSRTTPLICGVRDGLEYTVKDKDPIGHGEPWDAGPGRIHWNCRSSSAPSVIGVPQSNGPRPSIGAGKNYERGDNKNRRGKVQKPTKKAREEGKFKINIKTQRTKYEGWLRDQSRHNIDFVSDILGSKKKAQMFRDGKVTLGELGLKSPVSRAINKSQI